MIEIKDYVGNELYIGDEVVVLSSGNSSWRKGIVTGFKENFVGNIKVQIEYNDHWYCSVKHLELNEKPFKFYSKPVKTSVDTFNVVKLLPEYLNN